MSDVRRIAGRLLVPVMVISLLATACSADSKSSRSASGSLGDPTMVPALAAGPRVPEDTLRSPVFPAAVVTAENGVATSISPTIVASGAQGATTFDIRDLSTGQSGFHRTYSATGSSQRIPEGAGLADGGVYVWSATDATGATFGGSFQVDLNVSGVQATDTAGSVRTGLSSGEATFGWSTHAMSALPGKVGIGLSYTVSNRPESGVPAGWDLQAASSSPYSQILVREDGSVGLYALDGATTTYRPSSGGAYSPVALPGSLQVTGAAPVLTKNADGTWTVLNKQSASTFSAAGEDGIANLVSIDTSDKPMLSQKWSGGLLRSIGDPVSGREVELIYGGGDCGSVANGFVGAPANQLCRVKFWDGSTSSIWYVPMPDGTKQIGRLIDLPEAKGNGAQVTDISYDSVGRISATRGTTANSVIAAGMASADDSSLVSTIAYDELARVASITGQAATVGGKQSVRSYDYTSMRATSVIDSDFGGVVASVRFDPTNFRILSTTDVAGLTSTNEYNASGQLVKRVDENGNVSVNTYDDGLLVETRGPTEGSLASDATITKYSHDQSFATNPDGSNMTGLDISYWSTSDWTGRVAEDELGPRIDGVLAPSLTMNWAESPTGTDAWSARMLGVVEVKTEGVYSISASGEAKVWIDSVGCENNGCRALTLSSGKHQIRVDLSTTTAEASMSVEWNGPDTGGAAVAIPTSVLRPRYGYITTVRANDQLASGAPAESISHTVYDDPGKGQVSSRVSQSGAVSTLAYESLTGSDGNWGRQESTTMPSGAVMTLGYWGDTQSAKSSCPSASAANQGGLPKETVDVGTTSETQSKTSTYDAAGRVVASTIVGGATNCTTYDSGGRVARMDTLGMGRTESVVFNYGVDGNPLVSTQTITTGKDVVTTRTESDLLGRLVSTTDRNGIVETIAYDARTGNPAQFTFTAPSGATTSIVRSYDPQARLATIAVDGRVVARPTYNEDGTTNRVVYGNGTSADIGYDVSNRANSMALTTTDGHRASSTRDIAAGGRVMGAALALDSTVSNWSYTYDAARHLQSASLSAGITPAHTWAYTYDVNSNRTSQTFDGTTSTYTYDSDDRLLSSSDAAIGTLEYDRLGDVTKLGANTFSYDATRAVIGATDGTTTVAYDRDATGSIIARTTTDGSGEKTIRYGIGSMTLDETGAPLLQDIALPGGVTLTHPVGRAGSSTWGHGDLAGNRFVTTNDTGALVGGAQLYDPFGSALTTPVPPAPGQIDLTWLASSGNETQSMKVAYQLMGSRVYVPAIGRFLQVDPQPGGSANAYDFVNQDPVNLRDTNGQSLASWIAMITVAIVSVALTPFTGGGSILMGAGIGFAIGAAGYVLQWGIESAIAGQIEPFSVVQLCISAGVGAVFGAFGGGLGKLRNRGAVTEDAEIASSRPVSERVGGGVAAEIDDTATETMSQAVDRLEQAQTWYTGAMAHLEKKMGQTFSKMSEFRNEGREYFAKTMESRLDKMWEVWHEMEALGPEQAYQANQQNAFADALRAAGFGSK